jgi:pilus assembly protein FimV
MLVALHRANREAFSDDNMNRLKTGPILRIPDKIEIAAISPDAADKEVKMQTANWEAYRQKLAADSASIPSVSEEPSQTATGKITATIESIKAAKKPPKELLKISKGEGLGESSSEDAINVQDKIRSMEESAIANKKALNEANTRIALLENAMAEDAIAMEKALNETNERIALLEKNIAELKHLLELQNLTMASAQKQAKSIKPDAGAELSSSVTANKSNAPSWQWLWWAVILLLPIAGWRWKHWKASKNGNGATEAKERHPRFKS